jgi:DNA-binding response OmpR family regulator
MSKKVLIIDDDKVDQMTIRRLLEKAGLTDIQTASTGEDGIKVVQSEKPDFIIIDTILPGISGPDTCRAIKQISDAKIIITTGSVDAVDAYNARKAGADDYVVKAFDYSSLVDAVQKIFREHEPRYP